MLSLLKNKIRNKFLQTDYIHPYIIWCIDVFLSVISSFSIFLFFHYLINISIHFNQQRYILLIAVISSIVWTGICKTYEGIIRYSTLVELTRIIYAMLLKALTFVLFAYITLDYIGLFIYSIIITDFISSVFLLMCTRILTVNFYYHLLQLLKKPRQATLIYGISERGISLANYLRSENNPYNVFGFITRKPENKKYRLVGYQIYLIDEENSLRKLFSTLKVNCILFLSHTDLRNDEEIVQYSLENHICLRIAPFLYPEYPIFEGEKYVSLGYKYQLIDQDYPLLALNEVLVNVEYRPDGSSLNMYRQYIRNPRGFAFIRKSSMQLAPTSQRRFIEAMHYVADSLLARNPHFLSESPRKWLTLSALLPGITWYGYIRYKARKLS